MNLVISDRAKEKLKSYPIDKGQFLRISVVSGGCTGMTYKASIDSTVTIKDEVIYNDNDIKIVADKRSALFLDGLNIDFSDDLIKTGFRLTNPNISESCACGSSFST